jgi:scyllo-inositol 2-dehydrogenase (NAD+)
MAPGIAVLVVGLGKIGWMHASNVAYRIPRVRLAAVCDADAGVLSRAEAEFGVPASQDLVVSLGRADVDAVLIASPARTHAAVISAAVAAGKHVFSEKPVGLSLEDTDPVLQQVLDAGGVFQIGFQRRWDPDFREARRLIDAGAIGRPLLYKAHGRDPQFTGPLQDPATGGGIFLDAAIHDYDAARFIVGQEVERVSAHGATLMHHQLTALGDVDTCATVLSFAGGALGLTEWNRIACYGYDVFAEVLGDEGALRVGGLQRTSVVTLSRAGATHDVTPWFADRFGEAYCAEVEAFAESVLSGGRATPGIEDARRSLQIACAARDAYRTGAAIDIPALAPLVAQSTR